MDKKKGLLLLIISDLISVNIAWAFYYLIRVESGWIKSANPASFLAPMIAIYLYWFIIFSFAGLYQYWFVRSRFDEFALIFKAVTLGCLVLFFAIFIDDYIKDARVISRLLILIYWFVLIFFVSFGRIIIRGFQFRRLEKGFGLRNTFIIGTGFKARELLEMVRDYPRLGYKFSGFIGRNGDEESEFYAGNIDDLKALIDKFCISEIIIACEQDDKDLTIKTLNLCSELEVNIKIMPDMQDIVSGMAKTEQIYGIPLIEVKSQLLNLPSRILKRTIDVVLSILILILFLPVLLIFSLIIKLTSSGPVFYVDSRLGKSGKPFKMLKFRTMIAADNLNNIKDEDRITAFGRFLRKTHLDDMPQFINVLKADMSIVGPRPETPQTLEILKKEVPYYSRKLTIKPGITGWAQIKYRKYSDPIGDIRKRLQFDFFYVENISVALDLKIMFNTLFHILSMKGR